MTQVLWLNCDMMGCGFYRCATPAWTLRDTGRYKSFFVEHKKSFTVAGPLVGNLQDIDLVVMQRAVHPVFVEWMNACHDRGIPVVFETDDDMFHIAKHNPVYAEWSKGRDVSRILVQRADHVVVSTQPLKDAIVEATGVNESKVTVCLNHLHPNIWSDEALADVSLMDNERKLVIGWQGSSTHDVDFRVAIPALCRILQEFPNTTVRLFGNVPRSIKDQIPLKRVEWKPGVPFEQYPRNLKNAHFDIGIAPLVDSKFNRAKSNIKYLEYSTLGIPTVASRVYPYARTITHGVNGFLAQTPEAWYQALRQLILDPVARRQVGQAAKDLVQREWSTTHGQKWVALFDRVSTMKPAAQEAA